MIGATADTHRPAYLVRESEPMATYMEGQIMTHQNDETRSGQGNGFQDTQQNEQANFTPAPTNIVHLAPERQAKETANLLAQFALAGHSVHRGDEGDFLVCRYGLSRWCEDFAELRAFAVRVGVRHE